ncbi:MAG TPA: RluA family pseudouridine synthase, partial [Dongiaceae bacterium]
MASTTLSAVTSITVTEAEADLRLDRWFKRHFPGLTHGRLEKLLRTGQIRVDGGRAKASLRLTAGQTIRVPPLGEGMAQAENGAAPRAPRQPRRAEDDRLIEELRRRVLHRDRDALIIDKPAGLAVQGGTATEQHLDRL